MARLRRVSSEGPGIVRRKHGRGFRYLDASGGPVRDPETLARIRALAIPPAWTDVWISPDPLGHLQAVGTDAAGRRQYRYHDAWRARRDAEKFDRMLGFARALPVLRERVAEDLGRRGLPRERVLAGAVRLLDQVSFRVGSESYARDNGSFGLATLRRDHVHLRDGVAVFDFTAKSGKRLVLEVADPDVLSLVRSLKRRYAGGPELLAYRDGHVWRDVRAADVNAYVKDTLGDGYSAKDFRTWHGTVVAAVGLALAEGERTSVTSRRRQVSAAIREVAQFLGNTPAVARASYVDPRVLDRFEEGVTIAVALERASGDLNDPAFREAVEAAVLDMLEEESPAVPRAA